MLYVEEVSEFTLASALAAISRFTRGEVEGVNRSFAPSVAEFYAEVKERQRQADFEEWKANTTFVLADSPEWKAMAERRGVEAPRSAEAVNHGIGWWFPKTEIEAIPKALLEKYADPKRYVSADKILAITEKLGAGLESR